MLRRVFQVDLVSADAEAADDCQVLGRCEHSGR